METILKTKSLRFWVALSMTIALVPLGTSAVGGFILLNHGVIGSYQDVASRQHMHIKSTQDLRLLLWEALSSLDEFVEDGAPRHQKAYRLFRSRIETGFASLDRTLSDDPAERRLVHRALDNWTKADGLATELISVSSGSNREQTNRTLQMFHGEIAAASDMLSAVYSRLMNDVEQDYLTAGRFYERALWLTAIAGAVSLLTVALGIFVIGRIMTGSVDRLVDGALRFAEGDRDHRIDVKVPPELHRVAEEFNHMIGRIRQSEEVLSDLVQRDALTGMSNRRAFDEGLTAFWERVLHFGEEGALLVIDIDFFKLINDSHGHAAGDEVLRALGEVMTRGLRPGDQAFRIGGEEFAVLLPKSDRDAARQTAERLRQSVAGTHVMFKGERINFTASIGVATTASVVDPGALLEAADRALYKSKNDGRNRVTIVEDA